MSDLDLDKLGALWREALPEEETRDLERSARHVSRRAKLALVGGYVLAAAIGVAVLVIVAINPEGETAFFGGVALLLLLLSQVRRRRYRQIEIQGLTGDTEAMIDQLIERQQATLKLARFSLWIIGPATVAGIFFGSAVGGSAGSKLFLERVADMESRLLLLGIAFLLIATMAAQIVIAMRKHGCELDRLIALREAYRQESSHTDPSK